MTDIHIAGTAVVVGPDDYLVITLPPGISMVEHEMHVDELMAALHGHPLRGRVFIISNADLAVAKAPEEAMPTHLCPPDGSGDMPCCGRSPLEVRAHRMTLDRALVTCLGRDDSMGTSEKETP